MTPASILVIEDEELLGRMICDNLQLDGHVPEHVRRGDLGLERLQAARFDLVILDIMLPGMNGFSVLESIRAAGDDTPVLILSARSSDEDRIRGLEHKADDYLTKPFNLKELLLRVHALLRRGQLKQPLAPIQLGENRIDFSSQVLHTRDGRAVTLTSSEAKLLRVLIQHRDHVVPRRELVTALFGPDTPVTVRTLDNLVLRLRKLLEQDASDPRHLHTVRGVGYRLTDGGPSPD